MEKFESERNTLFSVILGLVPRIHAKNSSLDTRVKPEYDRDLMVDTRDRLSVTPEYDNKKRMCLKPEYDREQSLIKGLDVVCQCAALLERLKTHTNISSLFCHPRAWLFARPEDLDSRDKPENDGKGVDIFTPEYDHNNLRPQCAPDATGFLSDVYKRGTRARKFLVDGVQCGRSMIEMLGVLAIIGVLSVGGIQGYSKAMTKFKINKTMQQIAEIATNIRTLYIQQNDFNSLSNTTAVQMGIVPDDLKTSDGEYGTVITNAFGSPVGITGNSYARGTNSDEFVIRFLNVTKEGCIALATADWGNSASSGLVAIGIGFFSGDEDSMLQTNDVYKNCTSQGEYGVHGYYACANHLPMSPALAAQYCTDTGENWGYDNSFGIKFSK